jgi:hypothetical protein
VKSLVVVVGVSLITSTRFPLVTGPQLGVAAPNAQVAPDKSRSGPIEQFYDVGKLISPEYVARVVCCVIGAANRHEKNATRSLSRDVTLTQLCVEERFLL